MRARNAVEHPRIVGAIIAAVQEERFSRKKHDSKFSTQREMDIAPSIQNVTEEVVCRLGQSIAAETGHKNLCLAGGVALNCVANGKLLRDGAFENIWIQPAAGDAGGALGAALAAYHHNADGPRKSAGHSGGTGDTMKGSYLGPQYDQADIEKRLSAAGAIYTVLESDRTIKATAHVM